MAERASIGGKCRKFFPLEIVLTSFVITFCIILLGVFKTDFNYLPKSMIFDNDTQLGIAKQAVPFMCSVQRLSFAFDRKYNHICGCSIIDSKYVLTAAHCVKLNKLNHLSILFGTNVLDEDADDAMRYTASDIKIHPDYEPFGGYDVALIQVSQQFKFDGHRVDKIPITNETQFNDRTDLLLIGWGAEHPIARKQLEIVTFRIVHSKYCYARVKILLTENEICVFSYTRRGACKGDSGGPIVDIASKQLIGMVSYARKACEKRDFYVFSLVQPYQNWINAQITNDLQ